MILSAKLHDELLMLHQTALEKNQLTPPEKLESYYLAFRERFGPEKLRLLEGTELLETMHARGNKDSLVYWLEFGPTVYSTCDGGFLRFLHNYVFLCIGNQQPRRHKPF